MFAKIKQFFRRLLPYIVSSAIALAVGGLSILAVGEKGMRLFDDIVQPLLTPPAIVFPIAWTVLYILMGVGAARVWLRRKEKPAEVRGALWVYAANLAVNFLWSVIFFRWEAFFVAFLWILLLVFVIMRMYTAFAKVDKIAANLQVPYLIWTIFATYLTAAVWILNR